MPLWIRLGILALFLMLLSSSAFSEGVQPTYRVEAEDTITVHVARHAEFSGSFLVPSDGLVDIPGVGQTAVGGKTLAQITDDVTSRLRGRLKEPEVSVTLQSAGMRRVYVLGAVQKPGLYDLKPGWGITQAVAAAGGLVTHCEPNDCTATVVKFADGKRQTVQMQEVMRGSSDANLLIQGGDVVMIDAGETWPVYVAGKVRSPGLYRVRKESAGVMEALALAGGTLESSALNRVTITHSDNTAETVDLASAALAGKQPPNVTVKPGDMILVPEDLSKIAVLGYVNKPGFYPIRNGEKLALSDALGLAGGSDNRRSEIRSVAIIRTENGQQTRMICDLRKFLKSGDMAYNPEIKPGDIIYVPQTSRPDWDMVMRSLSVVGILINPFIP